MAENKMTKKDWFAEIKKIVESAEYEKKDDALDFINHEIELLERKSSKTKKTKTQQENEKIMARIESALAEYGKPVTISEIQEKENLSEYSNQKMSSLLTLMIKAGKVERTEEKKKAYFALK